MFSKAGAGYFGAPLHNTWCFARVTPTVIRGEAKLIIVWIGSTDGDQRNFPVLLDIARIDFQRL
jgi:hypothetical protein